MNSFKARQQYMRDEDDYPSYPSDYCVFSKAAELALRNGLDYEIVHCTKGWKCRLYPAFDTDEMTVGKGVGSFREAALYYALVEAGLVKPFPADDSDIF